LFFGGCQQHVSLIKYIFYKYRTYFLNSKYFKGFFNKSGKIMNFTRHRLPPYDSVVKNLIIRLLIIRIKDVYKEKGATGGG